MYRGSVKDVLGPVQAKGHTAVVFRYSDAFSVFDWGRMPDAIPRKGEALALMGAALFSRLENPTAWQDFSRSQVALALRKGITSVHSVQLKKGIREDGTPTSLGSAFNELGERLQKEGLRTHYLGLAREADLAADGAAVAPVELSALREPLKCMLVRQVSVVKPTLRAVMGKAVVDYAPTREAPAPRLVPLEVVFRFGAPEGSSILERVAKNPAYWESLPLPAELVGAKLKAGAKWEFPVLELFTKLESTDRPVGMNEALAISGLNAEQMQELMVQATWIAGFLRATCAKCGLELWDGKLEFALGPDGKVFLVDAIGPDELRLTAPAPGGGLVHLSKEFIRAFYRDTEWYAQTVEAKKKAAASGNADWKRGVNVPPPPLPAAHVELVSQLYMTLTQLIGGGTWFPGAWSLDRLISQFAMLVPPSLARGKQPAAPSAQAELTFEDSGGGSDPA